MPIQSQTMRRRVSQGRLSRRWMFIIADHGTFLSRNAQPAPRHGVVDGAILQLRPSSARVQPSRLLFLIDAMPVSSPPRTLGSRDVTYPWSDHGWGWHPERDSTSLAPSLQILLPSLELGARERPAMHGRRASDVSMLSIDMRQGIYWCIWTCPWRDDSNLSFIFFFSALRTASNSRRRDVREVSEVCTITTSPSYASHHTYRSEDTTSGTRRE